MRPYHKIKKVRGIENFPIDIFSQPVGLYREKKHKMGEKLI
jgi:hypothetical protein